MKKTNKLLALLLTALMAFSLFGCAPKPQPKDDIELAIQKAGKYLVKSTYKPKYGDETMMLALLRSDYIDFWHNRSVVYEAALNNFLKRNSGIVGKNNKVFASEYPPVIYAYTALGKYADKTASADLSMGISFDSVVLEGGYINKINALTALKCGNYTPYKEGDLSEQDLIDFTLSLQVEDGSFQYKGMKDSTIKVTACAVQALDLVTPTEDISAAIEKGANYLKTHIRKDDSLDDVVSTIVALNSVGTDARNIEGNNLIDWILGYQTEKGSFTTNSEDKAGNKEETSLALLALASQYRLNNGKTSIYDMSDVLGGTHNKLSPEWIMYINMMKVFVVIMLIFMAVLLLISRIRIAKWKKAGIYNSQAGRMMTDAEIAKRDADAAGADVEKVLPEHIEDSQETKPQEVIEVTEKENEEK
ncbi:MAG: prenyltransferase/squalene oxidase repeat-containing protein [Oscillospiraceae bacterium]